MGSAMRQSNWQIHMGFFINRDPSPGLIFAPNRSVGRDSWHHGSRSSSLAPKDILPMAATKAIIFYDSPQLARRSRARLGANWDQWRQSALGIGSDTARDVFVAASINSAIYLSMQAQSSPCNLLWNQRGTWAHRLARWFSLLSG